MHFEGDAFISYAHLDNIELVEGQRGWVANLQRALVIRISQLLGRTSQVWWDAKLQGNDILADTLVQRLDQVATLVSILTPRYVQSDWSRKEVLAFLQAVSKQGGVRVAERSRIFKILKTPVAFEDHPPELRSLTGYEFFKVNPDNGKIRELNAVFGPEAEREFWVKLEDLAQDMCALLKDLEGKGPAPDEVPTESGAIYLAETTTDLRDQREAMKRELQQRGYTVLPTRPLPVTAPEMITSIRSELALCTMSIHMIGRLYSLVPEGGSTSLQQLQHDLAIERGNQAEFSHLVWMPPGLKSDDARQQKVIDELRNLPEMPRGADVLETPLEELWTVMDAWLQRKQAPPADRKAEGEQAPAIDTAPALQLYLIHDERDTDAVGPWVDYLFQQQFEVVRPLFEGDEKDIREYHQENLRICDGVLIFGGVTNEAGLRGKLREVQKSAGLGRTKPLPPVAVCLAAPKTADKERFRSHDALVIPQWDGFTESALAPFVDRLNATRERA
jgi:hypothetical protein